MSEIHRITVVLKGEEWEGLLKLARIHLRRPQDEARFILQEHLEDAQYQDDQMEAFEEDDGTGVRNGFLLHLLLEEREFLGRMMIWDVRTPVDQVRWLIVEEARRRGWLEQVAHGQGKTEKSG